MRLRVLLLILTAAISSLGQSQPAPPAPPERPSAITSPEVASDDRVTFRLRAPNANEVLVGLEGSKPVPMQKDGSGLWSLTVGPLDPDFYGYSFIADGVTLVDPSNWMMKPNFLYKQSEV